MSAPTTGAVLRTSAGRSVRLGARIDAGAAGEVFWDADPPSSGPQLVVKLLKHPSPEADRQLRAMVDMLVPFDVPHTQARLAWPGELIVDKTGHMLGFTMPAALGPQPYKLATIMHRLDRERVVQNLSYNMRIWIAHNIWAAAEHIHDRLGMVIGDVNESNFMVAGNGAITSIDCDSYQFRDRGGRQWVNGYHKPEYLPPELQHIGAALKTTPREVRHDLWSLSVLTFQLLMDYWHPFAGVPAGTTQVTQADAAARGIFAFAGTERRYTPPPGAPPWATMPAALQQQFVQIFTGGPRARRPSATEWRATLLDVASNGLQACAGARQHMYPREAASCPWCEHEAKLTGSHGAAPPNGGRPRPRRATSPPPPPRARSAPPATTPPPVIPGISGTPGPVTSFLRRHPIVAITAILAVIAGGVLAVSGDSPSASRDNAASAAGSGAEIGTGSGTSSSDAGTSSSDAGASSGETDTSSGGRSGSGTVSKPHRPGPATIIRRHYEAIDSGSPTKAFRLMSPRYRAEQPAWVSQQSSARPHINLAAASLASVRGRDAWVDVKLYARDTFASARSNTRCRRFTGRVHLRKVSGRWYYDPNGHGLEKAELPNGNSQCP